MAVDLGMSNSIVKSLQRRFVGSTNISDVYTGKDHIWPPKTITFVDFTSIQLRYIWNASSGKDYDTATWYSNSPISNLNNYKVGWSYNSSYAPYLYWGGDNRQSGAECVMLNVAAFEEAGYGDKMPDVLTIYFDGNWYGQLNDGNVTIECTAYKGGFIVKSYQFNLSDPNLGSYVFADKDGNLQLTDSDGTIKDYWYGEALKVTKDGQIKYYKIDQNTLKPIGYEEECPTIKCRNSLDTDQTGYVTYNGAQYKVWNQQINVSGVIIPGYYMVFNDDTKSTTVDGITYDIITNQIFDQNMQPYKEITGSFGYGYCAGGDSEFRGQQVITANCDGDDNNGADTSMGYITYKNSTKIGVLTVYNPINQN